MKGNSRKNESRRTGDDADIGEAFVQWLEKNRTSSYDDFLTTKSYRKFIGTRPVFSLYDKAERNELAVREQRAFNGPSYVLQSTTADIRLSNLGITGVLSRINEILRTKRRLTPDMHTLLYFCFQHCKDFGQAYALLRPRWHMDPSEALRNIKTRRKEDNERRSRALENDFIVDPKIPPRRLWDLWSNRVVPFWVVQVDPISLSEPRMRRWSAVSHSWMFKTLRHVVYSPINGRDWPIPIPIDTTLERIRIELLNLLRRHKFNLVWLDILCLRQEGMRIKERLRIAEWKIDVPAIGPIYHGANQTIYYLSGLGRPFEVSVTDFDDPCHWVNRAWTLQETQQNFIVAGRSSSSPDFIIPSFLRSSRKRNRRVDDADGAVEALRATIIENQSPSVWKTLLLMLRRSATSDLDKIAGLTFCLNEFIPPVPAYILGEELEDAWDRLIKAARPRCRAQLLFFPESGNGTRKWYPTWRQLKDVDAVPTDYLSVAVDFDLSSNSYSIKCYCLESCLVEGLSEVGDRSAPSSRKGKAIVADRRGAQHNFLVTVNHNTCIPDGCYNLIGDARGLFMAETSTFWVVGRKTEQGLVEKMSVIQVDDPDAQKAMNNIAKCFGRTTLQLL